MSRKYGCLFHNGRKNVILYYPTENKGESRMKKLIAILCVVVLAASAVIGVTSVRSSNKIKELNEDISAMQEAVTESQKNVDALTETVAAKDTEIETLTADVAEKNAQIAVLSETVEAHAGEITALNEQVAAAQTQIDALTADLTGAQDKLQQIIDTINGTKGASALPAVGDTVNGFEVKEIRDFPLIGAKLVLFEHRNTGAKLFYVANADTNRAFQIVFPTRPLDNTGLPHVFEHATLFGSDKYPATSLYFNVAYQTYNTYINAHTTDACTWYPLASLSEEQLLHLADYYIDACFHPLIMHDESIFKTQAWHYNLPDIEGELTYEGVVYSEMQGAMTLAHKGLMYANSLTFPGSVLALDEGGLPEDIPNMTWEDVKGYHDKFYHPSNSITYLYGQIADYAAFLALLDEAFTGYEKAEFTFEDAGYTPITEAAVGEYAHPMTEGTDVANQSVIYYYIPCPGMKDDPAEAMQMELIGRAGRRHPVLRHRHEPGRRGGVQGAGGRGAPRRGAERLPPGDGGRRHDQPEHFRQAGARKRRPRARRAVQLYIQLRRDRRSLRLCGERRRAGQDRRGKPGRPAEGRRGPLAGGQGALHPDHRLSRARRKGKGRRRPEGEAGGDQGRHDGGGIAGHRGGNQRRAQGGGRFGADGPDQGI